MIIIFQLVPLPVFYLFETISGFPLIFPILFTNFLPLFKNKTVVKLGN